MNKQFQRLKSVTPIGVNYSYDFAVEDSHRIIARKKGTNSAYYTSNCWHGDIREFIKAKQTSGQLTKFNISVAITSGFMNAVENDLDWDLKFPDTEFEKYDKEWNGDIDLWERKGYPIIIYESINARDLWNEITYATYTRNEPGIIFLDLVNKLNPLYYAEKIHATNPCVTGNTLVKTDKGDVSIKDIIDNGYENYKVQTFDNITQTFEFEEIKWADKTKEDAEIFELELEDGSIIQLTPDHEVWTQNRGYIQAKDLNSEDEIVLF